jgi:hypothetical protein
MWHMLGSERVLQQLQHLNCVLRSNMRQFDAVC